MQEKNFKTREDKLRKELELKMREEREQIKKQLTLLQREGKPMEIHHSNDDDGSDIIPVDDFGTVFQPDP